MSMLSKNLEKSLHRAFALAGERRHEYATLEHLLLAMTEDEDATPVLKACGVDIDRLRHDLEFFRRHGHCCQRRGADALRCKDGPDARNLALTAQMLQFADDDAFGNAQA